MELTFDKADAHISVSAGINVKDYQKYEPAWMY
jgi:hypothetical protein